MRNREITSTHINRSTLALLVSLGFLAAICAMFVLAPPSQAQIQFDFDESINDSFNTDSTVQVQEQNCGVIVEQYNNAVAGDAIAVDDAVAATAAEVNAPVNIVQNCIQAGEDVVIGSANDDGDGDDDGDDSEVVDPDDPSDPGDGEDPGGELEEEEQDEIAGPLAGGTAYGFDEIVRKDVIDRLPDGTPVYGIDRIRIYTEDCNITESEDLSFTLEESAGLSRVRDGDNVDITLKESGTFVIDGRREVGGESNPDRLIVPIPVDPDNYDFGDDTIEDTFPIASSTGVGGNDCKAVAARATQSNNNSNNIGTNTATASRESSVIAGTYNSGQVLAKTGGSTEGMIPVSPVSAGLMSGGALLVLCGVGIAVRLGRIDFSGRE